MAGHSSLCEDHRLSTAGWGKTGNVTSAAWQVTWCNSIWSVSPIAVRLAANCYTPFTFTFYLSSVWLRFHSQWGYVSQWWCIGHKETITQQWIGTFSTRSILVKFIHFCIISLCFSIIFWWAVNCRFASSRSCDINTHTHLSKNTSN